MGTNASLLWLKEVRSVQSNGWQRWPAVLLLDLTSPGGQSGRANGSTSLRRDKDSHSSGWGWAPAQQDQRGRKLPATLSWTWAPPLSEETEKSPSNIKSKPESRLNSGCVSLLTVPCYQQRTESSLAWGGSAEPLPSSWWPCIYTETDGLWKAIQWTLTFSKLLNTAKYSDIWHNHILMKVRTLHSCRIFYWKWPESTFQK